MTPMQIKAPFKFLWQVGISGYRVLCGMGLRRNPDKFSPKAGDNWGKEFIWSWPSAAGVERDRLRKVNAELLEAAKDAEIQADSASAVLNDIAENTGDRWAKAHAEQLASAAVDLRAAIARAEE